MAKTFGHPTRKNYVLKTQTRTHTYSITYMYLHIVYSALMQVAKMLHMSVVCPQ